MCDKAPTICWYTVSYRYGLPISKLDASVITQSKKNIQISRSQMEPPLVDDSFLGGVGSDRREWNKLDSSSSRVVSSVGGSLIGGTRSWSPQVGHANNCPALSSPTFSFCPHSQWKTIFSLIVSTLFFDVLCRFLCSLVGNYPQPCRQTAIILRSSLFPRSLLILATTNMNLLISIHNKQDITSTNIDKHLHFVYTTCTHAKTASSLTDARIQFIGFFPFPSPVVL